jgi:hypothetical protein
MSENVLLIYKHTQVSQDLASYKYKAMFENMIWYKHTQVSQDVTLIASTLGTIDFYLIASLLRASYAPKVIMVAFNRNFSPQGDDTNMYVHSHACVFNIFLGLYAPKVIMVAFNPWGLVIHTCMSIHMRVFLGVCIPGFVCTRPKTRRSRFIRTSAFEVAIVNASVCLCVYVCVICTRPKSLW